MNNQWIYHDSQKLSFRNPFGAVPCGNKVRLNLSVSSSQNVESVILRLWKHESIEEKVPMYLTTAIEGSMTFSTEITTPETPGLLWYYFIVTADGNTHYYGNNNKKTGGVGELYSYEPPSYQITVYNKDAATPHWFKDSVMYQIFVDRFYNGNGEGQLLNAKKRCYIYNHWEDTPFYRTDPETGKTVCFDFFGGNLLGVMKKLPYLKELGINIIYFNPIFEASSNHKYDTGDYKKIDPMFGNNELFKELCKNAKEMGISIILDGVFSHTGSDSIYFNKEGHYPGLGAYQSKESPYYSWYIFHKHPEEYECWWGIDTLPNVNEMDRSYQDFIIYNKESVLKHWMAMGINGWRLDVVDELPEEFVQGFYKTMKEIDPDAALIGEVWEDASNKISYGKMRSYLLGSELDSVMNYPFRNILISYLLGHKNARETHQTLMSIYENYPREHFYSAMNILGTHDVPRILTILGDAPPSHTLTKEQQACYKLTPEKRSIAIARLKMLCLFQMTFPGVPCIYYGDEVEMEGYGDPLCRATFPWGMENSELQNWYKKMIRFRRTYDALSTGWWISLSLTTDVYGYIRMIENSKDAFGRVKDNNVIIVLFNRNTQKAENISIELSKWCQDKLYDIIDEKEQSLIDNKYLVTTIEPLESKIFIQNIKN